MFILSLHVFYVRVFNPLIYRNIAAYLRLSSTTICISDGRWNQLTIFVLIPKYVAARKKNVCVGSCTTIGNRSKIIGRRRWYGWALLVESSVQAIETVRGQRKGIERAYRASSPTTSRNLPSPLASSRPSSSSSSSSSSSPSSSFSLFLSFSLTSQLSYTAIASADVCEKSTRTPVLRDSYVCARALLI